MEIEREARGGVVRDYRLVYMHGTLRLTGGATREVKQREVLSVGGRNDKIIVRTGDQVIEIMRGRWERRRRLTHQQHVLECGHLRPHGLDFLSVQPSVVTSTRARAIVIRDTMGSGPNAE